MRKVALLEEKERERPAGGLTLLRTSYVVGPPAINAPERRTSKEGARRRTDE